MRYRRFFGQTVREAPKDAKAASHKFLYQGGFIRRISAGRYAFLPLGLRVWQKIVKIIDEEMAELGSQRLITPTLHPLKLWTATNRDQAFGELMLVVEDHHGATFAIGATAEGLMVELVKKFRPSYRDLPIIIHQFSQKFRDEKRPRGGLLRVREFMMKDAYSFHESEKDFMVWYQKFYRAYLKIAKRLDLETIPVLAHSGAIGGDFGHEFMVLSDAGEDTILLCDQCDYAANLERAESRFETFPQDKKPKKLKAVLGKGIIGVEPLAKFLKIPVTQATKTLLYQADDRLVAACIRGDYNINEAKLASYLGCASLGLASEQVVKKATGAEIGYAGPIGLVEDIKVVWDLTCKDRVNFEAGANRTDYHYLNVNFDRDVPRPEKFVDIREAKEGEGCPKCEQGRPACAGRLLAKRAVEFGHIFKQDHFYTGPMKGNFVDKDGKEKPMWMGAYGIGIGRAMALIVETHHDDKGIIWPEKVAPFLVYLVEVPSDKPAVREFAKSLYQKLKKEGVEVLYDDRDDISAGVKFADADLIGCPVRLVVSEATVGDKRLEWKLRNKENVELITPEKALKHLRTLSK